MTRWWIFAVSQSSRRSRANVSSRSGGRWTFAGWIGYPVIRSPRAPCDNGPAAGRSPPTTNRLRNSADGETRTGCGGANDTD